MWRPLHDDVTDGGKNTSIRTYNTISSSVPHMKDSSRLKPRHQKEPWRVLITKSTTTQGDRATTTTMTIDLYPPIVHEQDLSPDAFGPAIDDYCEEIHDAVKGFGANKSAVIDGLADQDATNRFKISLRYKELYGKELLQVMKKEFSGDFGAAMQFLSLPSDKAEARMIRMATKGMGASVDILFSICCGRTNTEIHMLKKAYFEMYTKDLNQVIASETRGDNERLLLTALQASEQEYDPLVHTKEKAIEDAEYIHSCGLGKTFGTDEKNIFKAICAAPPQHLTEVSLAYAEKYGYSLEKAMEKEFTGKAKEGLLFTIGMKLKPFPTIAKLVKSACAGIGTNEMLLIDTIIRYQVSH